MLDEADKLLDMDFEQEIDQILKVAGCPDGSKCSCSSDDEQAAVTAPAAGASRLLLYRHHATTSVLCFSPQPHFRSAPLAHPTPLAAHLPVPCCAVLPALQPQHPPQLIPRERRTQLFSATMTNKVAKLQRACLVSPVKIEVAHKYSTVDTLRQQYCFIPAKYKDCYLAFVLNELSGSTAMVRVRPGWAAVWCTVC